MGVAINFSSSRGKRRLKSEARRKKKLRVEFNNLRLLKIIPDPKNKSISMQNLWDWGGRWPDRTEKFQVVLYTRVYQKVPRLDL